MKGIPEICIDENFFAFLSSYSTFRFLILKAHEAHRVQDLAEIEASGVIIKMEYRKMFV
jgi:hypothetical protein